jgi:secreted PhoX family phosphatase
MKHQDLSFDQFDEFNSPERAKDTDMDVILSRRYFIKGSAVLGAAAFVTTAGLPSLAIANPHKGSKSIDFKPVKANSYDEITLPDGYSSQVVVSWGDNLSSNGKAFNHQTLGTAETQAFSVGDNNDGMDIFNIDGKEVLAVNNEYVNLKVMFGNNATKLPISEDDIRKGMLAHGVTIAELKETQSGWQLVKDSPLNQRITPLTEMDIVGPARSSRLMKTSADKTGTKVLGTFNNCGNGKTPWGTYLTCEENFNGYFSSSEGEKFKQTSMQKRYGIAKKGKDKGYGWSQIDERFDVSKEPNECHRHGWVVEIDPSGKQAPKKLTALGRFKHENAECVLNNDGHVVVYLGDDERGEYLYRFVSKNKYIEGGDNSLLLEQGELFVARFLDNGIGQWVSLNKAGMSADETLIFARQAASKVDATTMDRPEWVAANPHKAEVYVALTNNKNRAVKDNQPINAANPRKGNPYGHIIRWRPEALDHTSEHFIWDFYAIAGNPTVHSDGMKGSQNITKDNMFNSPDGLKFDSFGQLWIQTDGKYSNKDGFAGMGNNQMLLGDPQTGEIKRFLVGPRECEVTGLTWSTDKKTMFVGIQHPGEKGKGKSHWPEGGNATPRSSVIAIKRNDGGRIG